MGPFMEHVSNDKERKEYRVNGLKATPTFYVVPPLLVPF